MVFDGNNQKYGFWGQLHTYAQLITSQKLFGPRCHHWTQDLGHNRSFTSISHARITQFPIQFSLLRAFSNCWGGDVACQPVLVWNIASWNSCHSSKQLETLNSPTEPISHQIEHPKLFQQNKTDRLASCKAKTFVAASQAQALHPYLCTLQFFGICKQQTYKSEFTTRHLVSNSFGFSSVCDLTLLSDTVVWMLIHSHVPGEKTKVLVTSPLTSNTLNPCLSCCTVPTASFQLLFGTHGYSCAIEMCGECQSKRRCLDNLITATRSNSR